MDFFKIDNLIFSIGGSGVSYLEFFSVLFGLTTVLLATRGKSYNYWFGYVYNFLLFFLFLQKSLYSSMLLQPISLTIAIFGHYRWTHPKKDEENKKRELKVTLLSNKNRTLHIVVIALFTLLWGVIISKLHTIFPDIFSIARNPYLDAMITGTLLTAQYLSAQKKLECWIAWLVVNTSNITLYLLAGLVFMPMVSTAYLILAIIGIISWYKQYRTKQ